MIKNNLEKKVHKEPTTKVKSLGQIMMEAYKISESKGFYNPISKEDWINR